MQVIDFKAEHIDKIELQDMQREELGNVSNWLVFEPKAKTILDKDGTILFVGGFSQIWNNRACMWSLISKHAKGNKFIAITREVMKYLNTYKKEMHRLECYVDPRFSNAVRWAEMLGFFEEGRMYKFMPDGRDILMFSIINEVA